MAPNEIGHSEWRELAPAEVSERVEGLLRERMWYRLRTGEGRAEYDKRKISAEPVIGQPKTVQGCPSSSTRGEPQFERGLLRPVIDRIYPAGSAAEAHRRMESNENFGKLLLHWGS